MAYVEDGSDAEFLDQLECGIFQHLGQARQLVTDDRIDWRLGPCERDRLWVVTLHYHEWAWRLARSAVEDAKQRDRALALLKHYMADWCLRCGVDGECEVRSRTSWKHVLRGGTNGKHVPHALGLAWNAYAVATRIGWWTRCWQLLAAAGLAEQAGLGQRWLKSLWQHAAFLEQNLEWDLRANHLLRDAVGLAWAGRLFQGPEPGRWLDTASRLAVEQAAEQVLPDGGHFERSPMYHLHVMEDFATLSQLVEDPEARDQLRHAWRAMAEFSVWARHPDGQIPLLNDSALNGASTPDGVLRQGANLFGIPIDLSPRTGPRHFPEFGLVVWHGDPWSVFFDVGPIGPDYQPGHGHADSLTFEASYRGRRLFVDPGTCTYDRDARRDYDRSTAAHNTVCVDGEVSSEVWHIFRVGRRAYPQDVEIHITPDGLDAGAAHNGYRFLPGQPVHRRHLHVDNEGVLRLTDRVYGRGSHQVEGSLLLHPDCKASAMADGWLITAGTAQVRVRVGGPERLKLSVEDAVYHPRFGCEQAAQRLRWQVHDVLPLEVVVEICGERRT